MAASSPGPESLQVGPYLLEDRLGEGGMAEVWRARHSHLGQPVAIKFLSVEYARNPDAASRFYDEARIMFSLQHPNLVTAKDFLEVDGQYFLVMELMRGGSLADVMDRQPGVPFPLEQVLLWVRGVLAALTYAHATPNPPNPDDVRPVFHRDVKPTNILFDDVGTPKICDFGIARVTGATPTPRRATRTGFSMGTGGYMSPEQIARPGSVDGRSDLYNVGVVLYELLTAHLPFDEDEGFPDFNSPIPPRRWNPGISDAVEAVILRALRFHPAERFQTTADMAVALEEAARAPAPVLEQTPAIEPPPLIVTPVKPPGAVIEPPADGQVVKPPPPRSATWVWFVVLLIVAGIVFAIVDTANKERARREAQRLEEIRLAQEAENKRLEEDAAAAARRKIEEDAKQRESAALASSEKLSNDYAAWLSKRQTEMAPNVITVTLENSCMSGPIHVAMRFKLPDATDHWMTMGWWKVDAGTTVRPGIATSNANVYYFAESTGTTWSGNSETGSVTVPIVGNRFVHVDGTELEGQRRREVTMFRRVYNTWGDHTMRFTCTP